MSNKIIKAISSFCLVALVVMSVIFVGLIFDKLPKAQGEVAEQNSFALEKNVENSHETSVDTLEKGKQSLGEAQILMYHNIIYDNQSPSVYCITQAKLRSDFEYLKKNNYNVISFAQLFALTSQRKKLPPKCVLLTFDDGYLNNIVLGLPLLEEYGYTALISVVGSYKNFGKNNPNVGGNFIYLDFEDINKHSASKNIEWGFHSYALHSLRERKGVSKLRGEDIGVYKKMLTSDTQKLETEFNKSNVKTKIYAYPYGLYCKESEEVLRSLGFECTLSCGEGVNHITDKESLFLMKRFNRSGVAQSLKSIMRV